MTREEEIKQGSIDCIGAVNECNPLPWISFREGAKWADEHPKEGLVDIDKVVEWFYTYFYVHPHDCHVVQYDSDEAFEDMDGFVEQFKKAMEG